ncbi:MAG: hypothetical protein AAFX78_04325 [Cyanobacteria bacterium J06638_20]
MRKAYINIQRSPSKKENASPIMELAMEKSVNGLDTVTQIQ